jgi:hypothetical protein
MVPIAHPQQAPCTGVGARHGLHRSRGLVALMCTVPAACQSTMRHSRDDGWKALHCTALHCTAFHPVPTRGRPQSRAPASDTTRHNTAQRLHCNRSPCGAECRKPRYASCSNVISHNTPHDVNMVTYSPGSTGASHPRKRRPWCFC